MQVLDLISELRLTELKKLSLKTSDADILHLTNLGIAELYKRFPLNRENVHIVPVVDTSDYRFDSYDSNVPVQFFDTQLVLIEKVTAIAEDGTETEFVPSNTSRPMHFSTPTYNVLRIHKDFETNTLDVEIRLTPNNLVKTNQSIPLPPQMLELLRLYIAYKAFSSVSANIKDENNTYFVRFDSAATKMLLSGQYPLDAMDRSLLEMRGFV